jgi:flavin-dependent dehydrogenase
MHETDVVVVGGSVAGCAAATLLARQGARVTLLEKASAPEHYKRMCTHFIVPGARPVLRELGIDEALRDAGAQPNHTHVHTRYGWYSTRVGDAEAGWNLTRRKFDPLLRELAIAEPLLDFRTGTSVTGILREGGRVRGVRARTRDGDEEQTLRARVVVAADGRSSQVARMAGVPGRVLPHERIAYFGYFEGLELETGVDSLIWFGEPDANYAFPNDDGLTVLAAFVGRDQLGAFRADPYAALVRSFDGLERRPAIERGRLVGKVLGKVDMPNVRRPPARPGLAFVGDAAQASDPLWGVGLGFALMSASLLARALGPALTAGADADADADAALRRYRRDHARVFLGHHLMMSDYATGRPMNALERLLFATATHHEPTATMLGEIGGRTAPLQAIMRPDRLARSAAAAVRHRVAA